MLGSKDPEDINFETLLLHVLKCKGCLKIGFKFLENIDKREMNKLFSYATQYVEDTNVYAYYILGGILSAYSLPFVSWCCHNNHGKGRIGAIRFARNQGNLTKFVDLLCAMSRDPVVLSMIAFIEKANTHQKGATIAVKTMRMTID